MFLYSKLFSWKLAIGKCNGLGFQTSPGPLAEQVVTWIMYLQNFGVVALDPDLNLTQVYSLWLNENPTGTLVDLFPRTYNGTLGFGCSKKPSRFCLDFRQRFDWFMIILFKVNKHWTGFGSLWNKELLDYATVTGSNIFYLHVYVHLVVKFWAWENHPAFNPRNTFSGNQNYGTANRVRKWYKPSEARKNLLLQLKRVWSPKAVNYFADITTAWIVMLVYQIMFHCSIIDSCSSHNAPLPLMITAYKNINILFLSLLSLHVKG